MPKRTVIQREPTSIRLTPEAKRLLTAMAKKSGLSQAGWMETIIRREARRLKISAEEGDEPADEE